MSTLLVPGLPGSWPPGLSRQDAGAVASPWNPRCALLARILAWPQGISSRGNSRAAVYVGEGVVRCVLRKTLLATVVAAGIEETWGSGAVGTQECLTPLGSVGESLHGRRVRDGKNRIKERRKWKAYASEENHNTESWILQLTLTTYPNLMTPILRTTNKLFVNCTINTKCQALTCASQPLSW